MFGQPTETRCRLWTVVLWTGVVLCGCAGTAKAVDKNITANVNLSALNLSANDTVLVWNGNFTLTIDATNSFKVSGINADGNNAVIAFSGTNKLRLANSTGNVVIQDGFGGDISVTGTNAGAGFSATLETGEIIEVKCTIDDTAASNNWLLGNNTLLFSNSAAQIGTLQIGSDSGVAKIDVNETATIPTITPTGDFTLDIASGKTLTVTNAFSLGDNVLTFIGAGSTSVLTATGGLNMNNGNSKLWVTGSATLSNLDVGASGTILLADGVSLTLTDAVLIGANTLTLSGTTGSNAETITATGGFTLDNAASSLKITGDTANPLVVTKVAITGNDLNAGKGIDVDASVQITALTVSQNATLDVASGMTLSGTTTLSAAKTLTLNNTGTVSSLTTSTAAGTVNMTAAGTITTLTNNISGTVLNIDETSTITTLTVSQNTTVDVAAAKTLTTTATVAAGKILTTRETGTVSTVVLNGSASELNVTTAAGIITNLNVNANGGVLDVDNACTVTNCTMTASLGDLTVENASVRITTTGGFDVNDNKLQITQAGGTIDLVTVDSSGGELDIDETTTVTALTVAANTTIDVASSKTLTTTATVAAGYVLTRKGTGTVSTVTLNGSAAELNMTASGTVSTVNINANGAVLDIDSSCTLGSVSMTSTSGDTTLEVAGGNTLTGTIDINDNKLTITDTGVPGSIRLDTSGGFLDVDASCTPSSLSISANATIDVASTKTLTATGNISTYTLTLPGSGTITRVDASTGSIIANGAGTISDLRVSFGSGGTFIYGGTGSSNVTNMANSSVAANETFQKTGSGTLALKSGFSSIFSKATGVKLDIDAGEVILGTAGSNDNVTFSDDGDEITVASGATLTTYGNFAVSAAGSNVNLDAATGSIVNLRSSGGAETITAADNNDFSLLGTVNIDGTNGDYTLKGAFSFNFGNVNINSTGSLINDTPSSTMLFVSGSRVDLQGTTGSTFTIDGQTSTTPIVMGTTSGSGSFTIDRGSSDDLTIKYVTLSNATYTSNSGGAAIDELTLTGVADGGDNVNWFMAAVVPDEAEEDETTGDDTADTGDDDTTEDDNLEPEETETPETTVGAVAAVTADGTAAAGTSSDTTGATGLVDIENATSGSVFITIADGNLRSDFEGIPDEVALPTTMQVSGSVTGDFSAVVQLCYTDEMLDDSGLLESEMVLYVYDEPDGPWIMAGRRGQYRGDTEPTDRVGDHGINSQTGCVWAVRDGFSVFAVGAGSTDSSNVTDEDGSGTGGNTTQPPAGPPICGIFGMIYLGLTTLGLVGFKRRTARHGAGQRRHAS